MRYQEWNATCYYGFHTFIEMAGQSKQGGAKWRRSLANNYRSYHQDIKVNKVKLQCGYYRDHQRHTDKEYRYTIHKKAEY